MDRGQAKRIYAYLSDLDAGTEVTVSMIRRNAGIRETRQVQQAVSYVRRNFDINVETIERGKRWRVGGVGSADPAPVGTTIHETIERFVKGANARQSRGESPQLTPLTVVHEPRKGGAIATDDNGNLYFVRPRA